MTPVADYIIDLDKRITFVERQTRKLAQSDVSTFAVESAASLPPPQDGMVVLLLDTNTQMVVVNLLGTGLAWTAGGPIPGWP